MNPHGKVAAPQDPGLNLKVSPVAWAVAMAIGRIGFQFHACHWVMTWTYRQGYIKLFK